MTFYVGCRALSGSVGLCQQLSATVSNCQTRAQAGVVAWGRAKRNARLMELTGTNAHELPHDHKRLLLYLLISPRTWGALDRLARPWMS
eukprot:4299774-Prymnesium_polylepis.1